MAVPRLGQKRSDGKVYAGENYGYQSPASFSKLKDQGKFKTGAQTLDRATQAVSRVIPKPVKDYANAVQSAVAKNAETDRRNNEKTSIGRFQNRVNSQPSATERVLKGVSDKTNVDQRVVNTAANVAQAAIAKKVLGGAKPQPLPARSVGAAARADVAGRTVPATRRLPTSARPSGTVRAGSAAPSKALTEARRSIVRPNTAQVARQASGPAHKISDTRELGAGNEVVRQAPRSREVKRQLKEKATTAYVDQAIKGSASQVKPQPAGRDFRNYMPNRGRVSPTDKGRLAELNKTFETRRAKALEGLRGQARKTADNAFSRAETKLRKNIKYDAQREAETFQKAQEAKGYKGSSPKAQLAEADRMGRGRGKPSIVRDKEGALAPVQGPRRPTTQTPTTGTRRIAANPTSGTATTKTPDGDIKKAFGRGIRNVNPETGRPYSSKGTPSPTRKRGSNPADNFPSRPGRAKMEGEFPDRAGGSPIKANQTKLAEDALEQRPGFVTRATQKPGQHSGGIGLKGTSTQDQRQRRNGRNIGRLGQTPTPKSGVGQPSSALDTPALRTRRAANAARAKDTAKPTAIPPKRTAAQQAKVDQATAARKARQAKDKAEGRVTTKSTTAEVKEATRNLNYAKNADGSYVLPRGSTTEADGEVRRGFRPGRAERFTVDENGRQMVDGSVTRSVHLQKPKPQSRSADAAKKTKETMEAVRRRAAIRKAAEEALKKKKVKSQSIGNRARAKGTGETRRLSGNKQQRTIRGLLKRFRGG
jgi:hypothetical protein